MKRLLFQTEAFLKNVLKVLLNPSANEGPFVGITKKILYFFEFQDVLKNVYKKSFLRSVFNLLGDHFEVVRISENSSVVVLKKLIFQVNSSTIFGESVNHQ